MGLAARYRSWRQSRQERKTNKRLDNLEVDINMLQARRIKYNPKYYKPIVNLSPEQEFTLSIAEYYTWFSGKSRLLKQFYHTNLLVAVDLNYFWLKAPGDYRKVHSGLPGLASSKMGTILFGGGFTNDVTIYKTGDNGEPTDKVDEKASKAVKDTLEVLKDKSLLLTRVKEGAVTESWSGHLFVKLGYDLEASDYPIVEIADIRNAEVVKVRGITTAIIFKNYYTKGNVNYVHKETYTTDDKGDAVILNNLYKISADGTEKEIQLTTLDETKDLEPYFVFKGVKGMLAFEKPNKLPNNQFLDSDYGASDYSGAIDAFDALDEVWSEVFAELRANKTVRYVPSTMIRYLYNSETKDYDVGKLDPFVGNYVKIDGDPDQNAKNEIQVTTVPDKQDSLTAKWRIAITTALNAVGLSPYSVGITGLESVSASAESQQERNKTTLETRSDKIKIWQPFLENILMQLLIFNSWMQKNIPGLEQDDIDKIDLDYTNCEVTVKFGDYIIERQSDKITVWGGAKQQRVASTKEAITNIHDDWSDDKIDEEVNLIRYEEGMTLDTPDNLPTLTGFDEDVEPEEGEEDETKKKKPENKVPEDQTKKDMTEIIEE